jgi:hypothetical protein
MNTKINEPKNVRRKLNQKDLEVNQKDLEGAQLQ